MSFLSTTVVAFGTLFSAFLGHINQVLSVATYYQDSTPQNNLGAALYSVNGGEQTDLAKSSHINDDTSSVYLAQVTPQINLNQHQQAPQVVPPPQSSGYNLEQGLIDQKLLIQKNFFSKQIDRIYDSIQDTTNDLNDSIENLPTTSGVSFATVALGGTGLSTAPTYGQLLMGDGLGGYALVSTSSLGISSGGSSQWTTSGSDIFYSGGSVLMDSFNATSTATSTIAGGLSIGTATSSGLVTLRPMHSNQPALAIIKNQSFAETSPLQTWDMFSSDRQTLVDQYGLKINRIGSNTISVNYSTSQNQSYNQYSLLVDGTLPGIFLRSSNSGTVTTMHLFNGNITSPTINGSDLGGTKFYGTDIGGGYREAASISAVAESDFTILPRVSPPRTGNGRGALVFSTNDDAVSTFGSFRPTERMRINSLGNVGIGTTSPYAKLSVAGSIVMDSFSATSTATSTIAGGLSIGTASSTGNVTLRARHAGQPALSIIKNQSHDALTPLQSWDSEFSNLSTYMDGRGLKINMPARGVHPSISFDYDFYSLSYSTYALRIEDPNGLGVVFVNSYGNSNAINNFAGRPYNSTTGASAIYPTRNSILGSYAFYGQAVSENNAGYRNVAQIDGIAEGNFQDSSDVKGGLAFSTSDNVTRDIYGRVVAVERMRLSSLGNLGLGTSSPYARLSVNSFGGTQPQFVVASSTGSSATTTSLIVNRFGNVGIGTSSPTYKLEVAGNVGATAFINMSSRSVKKDIEYVAFEETMETLDKIKNLKFATYRYISESDNEPLHLGLIAEESPSDILAPGGQGIDVYKLATFALQGIQSLLSRVEKLEANLANITSGVTGIFKADSLEVEKGITIKDSKTGEYYCIVVENGSMKNIPGKCGEQQSGQSSSHTNNSSDSNTSESDDSSDNSDDLDNSGNSSNSSDSSYSSSPSDDQDSQNDETSEEQDTVDDSSEDSDTESDDTVNSSEELNDSSSDSSNETVSDSSDSDSTSSETSDSSSSESTDSSSSSESSSSDSSDSSGSTESSSSSESSGSTDGGSSDTQ